MTSKGDVDPYENLRDIKYEYDKDGRGIPEDDMDKKAKELLCTFSATGETLKFQMYFHCSDCGLDQEGDAICVSCIRKCHKGHKTKYVGLEECFCDCVKEFQLFFKFFFGRAMEKQK